MDLAYKNRAGVAVRPAGPQDAEAIREIRNRAIERSTALWTNTVLSATDGAAWLDPHLRRGSAFVAEADGAVAGFGAYGPWRDFEGYRHTVEDSVYVHEDHHRRGVGAALLTAVIDAARHAGHRIVIADIEAGNTASIKLHERFGFHHVGTVGDAGTKFGTWLDLTIMRLPLR
ncbi:GNAT family N-acetyltransferase [Catenulispora yoronensis]|uniref:GNAT family N-acetyltransferase n=1 Tax=Catenulispora yoronensis TaxID=450799 RepID=A0ABP5GRV4_9ACTN